jgi:hypothetical protein
MACRGTLAVMAYLSRFIEERTIRRGVRGCPASDLEQAAVAARCASCRYNILHPGEAVRGCVVRTPPQIFDIARGALGRRSPALVGELDALIGRGGRVEGKARPGRAARWRLLAEAWQAAPGGADPAELEVVGIIARFAQAAEQLDEDVLILG